MTVTGGMMDVIGSIKEARGELSPAIQRYLSSGSGQILFERSLVKSITLQR
jgi:hypothetical protein